MNREYTSGQADNWWFDIQMSSAHSPTLLSLLLRHRLFIYDTWRAAHAVKPKMYLLKDEFSF